MKSKKPGAKRPTPKKVPAQPTAAPTFVHSVWGGIAIAVLGIFVGQAILYGPSLIGKKILLPLDLLTLPGIPGRVWNLLRHVQLTAKYGLKPLQRILKTGS